MVACDCVFDAKVHSSPFLVLVFFQLFTFVGSAPARYSEV